MCSSTCQIVADMSTVELVQPGPISAKSPRSYTRLFGIDPHIALRVERSRHVRFSSTRCRFRKDDLFDFFVAPVGRLDGKFALPSLVVEQQRTTYAAGLDLDVKFLIHCDIGWLAVRTIRYFTRFVRKYLMMQ